VHPGENAYNSLVKRQEAATIAQAAAAHATGRLVDIGCGRKPYAALFAPYVTEHVGVDHNAAPQIDVVASAYAIPLPDASFQTALMAQVLEHLEEPLEGLREAHRLLAPGGKLILTTPFIWPLHEEPRDFFRYSPYGLRHVLARAGFVDADVLPSAGQWSTLHTMSGYALRTTPLRALPGVKGYIRRRGQLAGWLDRRAPRPWMTWGHIAVAVRPDVEASPPGAALSS
jgi:ubiquinone/menaquinone biosynthesis C-methylase UbiE